MPKWLKITLLIVAGIILFLYALNEFDYYWQSKKDNVEGTNVNLNFIDKLGCHYILQVCHQDKDGSIYVVSGMSDRSWYKDYISIIKLSPKAKALWETKTRFGKANWKDLLPRFIRDHVETKDLYTYGVCGISIVNNKLCLLVNQDGKVDRTFEVWQFSLLGKLEKKLPVKLQLNKDVNFAFAEQNDLVCLSYLDEKTNTICLERIVLTDGSLKPSVKYIPEQKLSRLEDMWSNESEVVIATTDSQTNACILYYYKDNAGFLDYYETKPGARITSMYLKYFFRFAAVQQDSLLEITDVAELNQLKNSDYNFDMPLFPADQEVSGYAEENLGFTTWTTTDMQFTGSDIYVCFMYSKPGKKPPYDVECMVRKYSLISRKYEDQFRIQGSKLEMPKYLFTTPDKQLIALGTSFSTSQLKLMRVFATKFKL